MSNDSHLLTRFDPDIGYVHTPNSSKSIKLNCVDFNFNFNSFGFNDKERDSNTSKPRIFMIGDSFTEGFGVKLGKRVSDLLEKNSKVACLNMGITGLGITQSMEVYRKYSDVFDHDAVLLGIYPANDFIDDNPNIDSEKKRPYWIFKNNEWKLQKPGKYLNRINSSWIKRFLVEYTFTYNAYLKVKNSIIYRNVNSSKFDEIGHSNYSEMDWKRMELSLRETKKMAGEKSLAIYSIPSKYEILSGQVSDSKLLQQLNLLCKEIGIEFLDFSAHISKRPIENQMVLYNSCESHWNAAGHQFAAKFIIKNWSYYD